MFTLIENGEVYAPPLARTSVLLSDSTILKVGDVDPRKGGKRLFRDGELDFKESYLKQSNRVINLVGEGE